MRYLISANGQLTLHNAVFLRDAVFFLLLGIAALRVDQRLPSGATATQNGK